MLWWLAGLVLSTCELLPILINIIAVAFLKSSPGFRLFTLQLAFKLFVVTIFFTMELRWHIAQVIPNGDCFRGPLKGVLRESKLRCAWHVLGADIKQMPNKSTD